MAGIASDMLLAVRESAIDCAQHDGHPASDHLRLLLIRGLVLGMAVIACSFIQQPQRLHEGLHRLGNGGRIQHLDVLEAGSSASRRPASSLPPPLAPAAPAGGAVPSPAAGAPL